MKIVDPEAVESGLDESVAVLMLTEVGYRTGRRHDMRLLTEKAMACGATRDCHMATTCASPNCSARNRR